MVEVKTPGRILAYRRRFFWEEEGTRFEYDEVPDDVKKALGWKYLDEGEKFRLALYYEERAKILHSLTDGLPEDENDYIDEKTLIGASAVVAVPYLLQEVPEISHFNLQVYAKYNVAGKYEWGDERAKERKLLVPRRMAFSRSFWEKQLGALERIRRDQAIPEREGHPWFSEVPRDILPELNFESLLRDGGPEFPQLEEFIEEQINKYFEKYEDPPHNWEDDLYLAISSPVLKRNQQNRYLPLMDIKAGNSPTALENLRKLLGELGETRGLILASGESFHYWGLRSLTLDEWRRWMRQWYFTMADNWYVAYSLLKSGPGCLRLTNGFYKPEQPRVVEVFGS